MGMKGLYYEEVFMSIFDDMMGNIMKFLSQYPYILTQDFLPLNTIYRHYIKMRNIIDIPQNFLPGLWSENSRSPQFGPVSKMKSPMS